MKSTNDAQKQIKMAKQRGNSTKAAHASMSPKKIGTLNKKKEEAFLSQGKKLIELQKVMVPDNSSYLNNEEVSIDMKGVTLGQ